MKKNIGALLAGLSMAALLAGGCANKESVKKEEAVVPAVVVEKVEPAKTAEQNVVTEPVKAAEKANELNTSQEKAADSQASMVAVNKFETVYFDFDKSDLRQDARDVLSKNAETILKSLAGLKLNIEGHCDERGSAEYNLALGERRAKSVQNYLTTLGVKAENLTVVSYGKEKPAVNGNDESAWAKNRRAEFVIVK